MSATDTALQESAQAIFCSLADYLGKANVDKVLNLTRFPTFVDFINDNDNSSKNKYKPPLNAKSNKDLLNKALTRVKIDVDTKLVYEFLKPDTKKALNWYKSSVLIATAIVKQLNQLKVANSSFAKFKIGASGYEAGQMFYLRGDSEVMGNIAKLFKIATNSDSSKLLVTEKKAIVIKDINKWSPADIYFANKLGRVAIQKELLAANNKPKTYDFDTLNLLISDQINLGQLLPLSLKKTSQAVKIELVNFDPKMKARLLKSVTFEAETMTGKTSDWTPYIRVGGKNVSYSQSWIKYKGSTLESSTRAIQLKIKVGNTLGQIQIRHDPSGSFNGRLVVEFIGGGAEARGGSVGSANIFHDIWATKDKDAAAEFLTNYKDAIKNFAKKKKSYEKNTLSLRKNLGRGKNEYDHYMAIASAELVTNKIMPQIKEWFRTSDQAKPLIKLMFRYVTSREPRSSKFVIAK